MLPLHELQSAFLRAMFAAPGAEASLLAHCQPGSISPQQGLQTYRRGIQGQRHHALEVSYPVLVQVVGMAFFRSAASIYIAQTPSRQGNLNCYGDTFGDFLSTWQPASQLPYLGDLARLEWAVQIAHDAPDAEIRTDTWREIAPEDYGGLRLRFQPALVRFNSPWPVGDIWRAHQDHNDEALQRIDFTCPASELVCRTHGRVQVRALTAGEVAWYDAIGAGLTLSEALEHALARQSSFDLSTALLQAVHDGIVLPPPLGVLR